MAENACSHLYFVKKRHINLWANVRSSGIFSQGDDCQNWIMSEAFGAEEGSSNFILNDEFVFRSMSFICILLGIFIIFCSLSEYRFIKVSMPFLLYQNHENDFLIRFAITFFFLCILPSCQDQPHIYFVL